MIGIFSDSECTKNTALRIVYPGSKAEFQNFRVIDPKDKLVVVKTNQ